MSGLAGQEQEGRLRALVRSERARSLHVYVLHWLMFITNQTRLACDSTDLPSSAGMPALDGGPHEAQNYPDMHTASGDWCRR